MALLVTMVSHLNSQLRGNINDERRGERGEAASVTVVFAVMLYLSFLVWGDKLTNTPDMLSSAQEKQHSQC